MLIGIGNEYRRDDGVGPAVVRSIRRNGLAADLVTLILADPMDLLELWQTASLAVLVDAAVDEPRRPGAIHRVELGRLVHRGLSESTHGLGLSEAIRLSNVLERTPEHVVVLSVEAERLGFGRGLSPDVAAAVPAVTQMVLAEVSATRSGQP